MDLPTTSRLYQAAIAAARFADQRLESRTRSDYSSSLRRFSSFCKSEGYPDPLKERFVELPVPRGNPARSAAITQILAGLSKSKKRERTPKRASPMSLLMLTKIITFLESNSMFNDTMRLWFSAVCSLSFYGMCRINEVLLMKKGDIQLGLKRKSRVDDSNIEFGCFTIRDRKTDHDPLASRTYSLHHLSNEERAAEALTFLDRWFTYARKKLHHTWRDSDYAFPSLTKVPRGASKKRRRKTGVLAGGYSFATVGIKWGSPMSDSNFTQVLNIIAEAAGISRNLLGDEIWLTSTVSVEAVHSTGSCLPLKIDGGH
ncbi:hypothetical protein AM587_10000055 [Phytophthora nicotianae]|uniref:Uncharacterized protein n=1 Tax=Phytophthora nicotianae TaxID=4792 RepID=A0A0W8C365_PHYNI|nr:hypothetical protein AM587_10000055 [Phytophthora nicotianae]